MAEDGSKQRKNYLLSDLSQVVGDMTFLVRDWLISALAEISEEQLDSYSSTGEMFVWYSFLNIGATSHGILWGLRLWQSKRSVCGDQETRNVQVFQFTRRWVLPRFPLSA
jgi:hypothetical protein